MAEEGLKSVVWVVYTMYNSPMQTRVTKWGNSVGIRLPKIFAAEMGMQEGVSVHLQVKQGALVITPAESLETMLGGITPDMLHSETDFGGSVGKEVW